MRHIAQAMIVLGLLILAGMAVWQIGSRLSSDAIGMGVGVLFGILAGLPTALLVLASSRRRDNGSQRQAPAQPTILLVDRREPEPERWYVIDAREWLLSDSDYEVGR